MCMEAKIFIGQNTEISMQREFGNLGKAIDLLS